MIHTLGLVLLGGSIVGAALLLIWQQWAVVTSTRDYEELSLWERRR